MSGDGMRVIVGAPWNDANGDNSGYARVYKEVDGNWFQVGSDIDGEAAGDQSGISVAISGDGMRVIVGANLNDGNGLENPGHARVFKQPSSSAVSWSLNTNALIGLSFASVFLVLDGGLF
jgi:hypothetical protein